VGKVKSAVRSPPAAPAPPAYDGAHCMDSRSTDPAPVPVRPEVSSCTSSVPAMGRGVEPVKAPPAPSSAYTS